MSFVFSYWQEEHKGLNLQASRFKGGLPGGIWECLEGAPLKAALPDSHQATPWSQNTDLLYNSLENCSLEYTIKAPPP